MGSLIHVSAGSTVVLRAHCLIGRSPACDVRVDDPRVSGEHASLRWTSAGWELRDLASKNGTFVDERRLSPNERAILVAGTGFCLGSASGGAGQFLLADAAPPVATATHLGTGTVKQVEGGALLLPNDEQPSASLVESGDGRWQLETAESTTLVSEGDVVIVDGERWRLDLPSSPGTVDASAEAWSIAGISLRIGVSRDEERVEVTILGLPDEPKLPPRSYQYMLLTLARARLADANPKLAERGWVERDDLCRMLKVDEYKLNVDVCRARKQFAALKILGANDIVQRRVGTGLLRLGVERVHIQAL
ncbi:MAG: FHA domain-containing protein [Polyangiaceae bacterium]